MLDTNGNKLTNDETRKMVENVESSSATEMADYKVVINYSERHRQKYDNYLSVQGDI